MSHRWTIRCIVIATVVMPGGCPPSQTNLPSNIARSVDGYWLITELDSQSALSQSSIVEYWYMRSIGANGDSVGFEITDACDTSKVLATGELSSEGVLALMDGSGGFVRFLGEFVDDHRIEGVSSQDNLHLIAQRIEQPDCTAFPDDDGIGVNRQPLKFVVEDDESLETLAAAAAIKDETQQSADPNGALGEDEQPNGVQHLESARGKKLPFGDDYDKSTGDASENCHDGSGNSISCPTSGGGQTGVIECSVQNWSESKQKTLVDVVALSDQNQVYPGALLQGRSFAAGSFTPITIARAGGVFTLTGLSLSGAQYSASVDEVSFPNVTNAVAQMLQNNQILGTRADSSIVHSQVYSAEQFNLSFGVDIAATGLPANISGQLNVDTNSTENLVVLQFTQVYYTVSFSPPEHSWSAFRDDRSFDDSENEIGEDNPPLYVDNVKYGRQVFLFFRSSYSATDVEAALDGAVNAEAANVKVKGNLTYKDVMASTRVTYIVRGGDAGLALDPIKNSKPEDLYQAILDFIANKDAAEYSVSSPGIPVAYTLRYLIGNDVAMTSYTISYDKTDCRTLPAEDFHYKLRIHDPSSSAWVYLDDTSKLIAGPYRSSRRDVNLDLNDFISDTAEHTLILQLYARCFWESASVKWDLSTDGQSKPWHDSVSKSFLRTCDIVNIIGPITTLAPNQAYEAKIRISLRNGKIEVLSLEK